MLPVRPPTSSSPHALSDTMHPEPLVIIQYEGPEPPNPNRKNERNASRTYLRGCFNGRLIVLTGRDDAKLWYGMLEYALYVVLGLGFKFNDDPGWPSDIPFRDLNRIPGGTRALKRLQLEWDTGRLRFVKATDEDKRNARLDPRLVMPNPAERASALAVPRAPSDPENLVHGTTDAASRSLLAVPSAPTTTGTVLHPSTMLPQFTFSVLPMDAQDAPSSVRLPERAQRKDINRSRKRPVTNPEGRELRRPKRGPMTARFVVEADGIAPEEVGDAIKKRKIVLTDENLTGCAEIGREASGSSRRI